MSAATRRLGTRIEQAEATRRKLGSDGDHTDRIPRQLRDGPERAENHWERRHVTAAGAEPQKPDEERKRERALSEAHSSLERAVEHLNDVRTATDRDKQDMMRRAKERLERA